MKNFNDYFLYRYIYIENKINLSLFIKKDIELENIIDLKFKKNFIELLIKDKVIKINKNNSFFNELNKFGGFFLFKYKDYLKVEKETNKENKIDCLINDKIKYLTFTL